MDEHHDWVNLNSIPKGTYSQVLLVEDISVPSSQSLSLSLSLFANTLIIFLSHHDVGRELWPKSLYLQGFSGIQDLVNHYNLPL